MDIFLTIFYALVFCIGIYYLKFFDIPYLSKRLVIIIFLLKILAGISFGIIHKYFYGEIDTFIYFNDSKGIYEVLFINPLHYLELVFGKDGTGSIHIAPPAHIEYYLDKFEIIYWGYHSEYIVIRFLSLCNIFTFGHYNANVVFIAWMSLIGGVYVYRLFTNAYPAKSCLFQVAVFLVPSAVFFTSGIHKEGLALFLTGALFWNFYQIAEVRFRWWRIISIGIICFILFYLRGYVLIFLLPNLIAYYWSMRSRRKVFIKYFAVHVVYWAVIFNLHLLHPRLDALQEITRKHDDFSVLKGNSNIPLSPFTPDLKTLIRNAPEALQHTLLRPFIWEAKNKQQLLVAIETLLMVIACLLCVFYNNIRRPMIHPILPLLFFFSLTTFILLGLIVPNLGALARYKSTLLPFWIAAFFMIADHEKFFGQLKNLFKMPVK